MNNFIKGVFLTCGLLQLGACAGGPMMINPRGDYNRAYFNDATTLSSDSDQVEKELTRSSKISYYPYYMYIEASPNFNALSEKIARTQVEKEAFAKRWDKTKQQDELISRLKSVKLKNSKTNCFKVKIITNDMFANDSSRWQGDLVSANPATNKIKFENFHGLVSTVTTSNQYGAKLSTSKIYTMYTEACSEKKVNLASDFSLKLMPRYKEKLEEVKLFWGKQKKLAKKKKQNDSYDW